MKLEDKMAIVTGAASRIRRQIAVTCAQEATKESSPISVARRQSPR
jgi:NAD(P)-dependent dehydrogenase (short-subunit alcohol dehydrogenase family)